jgi:hypothetical protein
MSEIYIFFRWQRNRRYNNQLAERKVSYSWKAKLLPFPPNLFKISYYIDGCYTNEQKHISNASCHTHWHAHSMFLLAVHGTLPEISPTMAMHKQACCVIELLLCAWLCNCSAWQQHQCTVHNNPMLWFSWYIKSVMYPHRLKTGQLHLVNGVARHMYVYDQCNEFHSND